MPLRILLGALDQLVDAGDLGVSERVPIRPMTQGCARQVGLARGRSGKPKAVKAAGAGSVSHMASIAASFIFWCSDDR
jgi:hypothetical protein